MAAFCLGGWGRRVVSKRNFKLGVAEEVERLAMIGGKTIFADGFTMFFGGITLVAEPVVLGIFLCQAIHIIIAIGLGEDAGGSNRQVLPVALDDAGVGEGDPT